MQLDISKVLEDNLSDSFLITAQIQSIFKKYLIAHKKTKIDFGHLFEEMHNASNALIKHQSNMVLLRRSNKIGRASCRERV